MKYKFKFKLLLKLRSQNKDKELVEIPIESDISSVFFTISAIFLISAIVNALLRE